MEKKLDFNHPISMQTVAQKSAQKLFLKYGKLIPIHFGLIYGAAEGGLNFEL